MSLQPSNPLFVPEETTRVAKAIYYKGNLAIHLRDELAGVYRDELFADLYPVVGQAAEAPWRLALVTVMQFAEDLPDREAADAVRNRIDWKYALGLELTDTGFDFTVLSKFRKRLLADNAEYRLLDELLAACTAKGLIKKRGQARTDSTHVLAKVRSLNRLGNLVETMRLALNTLATVEPEWLRSWVPDAWFERYGERFESFRLPKGKDKISDLAEITGEDGFYLLAKVYALETPTKLAELEATELLRRMWVQQFWLDDGEVRWRDAKNLPPNRVLLASPYDPDARLGSKRDLRWKGYKVHVTETCEEGFVHLITHVVTSAPNRHDNQFIPDIHRSLESKNLLPDVHLVDTGYMDTELLVESQKSYDVKLHGPLPANHRWQAKTEGAYSINDFAIDWKSEHVTCPNNKRSVYWSERIDKRNGNELIYVLFAKADCFSCEQRARCHRSTKDPRAIAFKPQEKHEALQAARRDQQTPEWHAVYSKRSGIEGTLSQGVRAFGLRRSRYFGQPKMQFQNVAIATAINVTRLAAWFDHKPRSKTRVSRFARLAA
jgi:transposase